MEDERLEVYLSTLTGEEDPSDKLTELRKTAERDGVPIIRRATERYLKTQLALYKPKRILEVGTAVAYSAIMMASDIYDCHIDTIEDYEPRIQAAKQNIKEFGLNDRITLIEGDATEVLKRFADEGRSYDMVFLDAAKGQYINQWPYIKLLLRDGAFLVADNVLQDGSVLDSRFAVKRRDRTIHERMREFLEAVFKEEGYICDLLPIGDGLAVAVKRQDG